MGGVNVSAGNTSVIIHGVGGVGLWAVSIAKAVLPAGVKVFAADIAVHDFTTI